MTAHQPDPLLTVDQVAERLQLSPWQVRALIRGRKLAAINISAGARPSYRIRPSALDAFLRIRRVA